MGSSATPLTPLSAPPSSFFKMALVQSRQGTIVGTPAPGHSRIGEHLFKSIETSEENETFGRSSFMLGGYQLNKTTVCPIL